SLVRAPAFTAAAVLTLGLGIGANSAFFSVLDGVVRRPLPLPDADRFVHLAWDHGEGPQAALTPIQFEYWRDNTRSFEGVATYKSFLGRVDAGDHVDGVPSLRVSRGFLDVLGFTPSLGRDLAAEEDVPDGPKVALVSQQVWQSRLGGSPDAVGQTLRVNEAPYTVVGVLPPAFAFPGMAEPVGIVVPLGLRADPKDEGQNYPAIARLRDGVSMSAANEDVSRLLSSFATEHPNQVYEGDRGMAVTGYTEAMVGDLAGALWMAMGSVFLVLLIACANVANLILARSARRRREIALRSALGASRVRIARLVVTEGVVLALAAGALGLLLAHWGVGLVALSPAQLPRMADIGVDWRVAAFTLVTALGTGVFFGAVGAWPALRADLAETMKDGARGSSGRNLGRQGLLAAQAC
ncbi:MAG TPA: ABC transporter permease, partial [Longimicrobiales bacterium]|nr:ABC transporter permease [Longimicrobiales bacterium]